MTDITLSIPTGEHSGSLAQEGNMAWAEVVVPLSVNKCIAIFRNRIGHLLRINPLYEVSEFTDMGAGQYRFRAKNLSNEQEIDTALTVSDTEYGFRIDYSDEFKMNTELVFEHTDTGAKIRLIEYYPLLSEEEQKQNLEKVDKSLVPWARYLQEYLVSWRRWSWLAPWRWYMNSIWINMKPSARRITYMLLWITFVEIVAFLMIFVIFWFEMDKYFD